MPRAYFISLRGLIATDSYAQWSDDCNVLFCVGGVLALNILESRFVTPMVLA